MAQAVIRTPNPVNGAVIGVTGAMQGAIKGEEFNEDKRQFNEDLSEKARQFDADLSFRINQLEVMQKENKLDRDQQKMLEEMRQTQENFRQGRSITSEEGMQQKDITSVEKRQDKQLTHEAVQNEEDRGVRRFDIRETATTQRYGIKKDYEAKREGMAIDKARVFDEQKKLQVAGQIRSKYGDPATWTPEVRSQAYQEYEQSVHPVGSVTGERDIPQITGEARSRTQSEFQRLTMNYPAEVQRLTSETEALAKAESSGRAQGEAGTASAVPEGSFYDYSSLLDDSGEVSKVTGQLPLKVSDKPALAQFSNEFHEMDMMVLDAKAMTDMGLVSDSAQTIMGDAYRQIDDRIDSLVGIDPYTKDALRRYYKLSVNHIFESSPPLAESPEGTNAYNTVVGE